MASASCCRALARNERTLSKRPSSWLKCSNGCDSILPISVPSAVRLCSSSCQELEYTALCPASQLVLKNRWDRVVVCQFQVLDLRGLCTSALFWNLMLSYEQAQAGWLEDVTHGAEPSHASQGHAGPASPQSADSQTHERAWPRLAKAGPS